MAQCYDLIVLGAGSGGLAAAKRAAKHGARVVVVEGDQVGGTCVIRGCVPKKLLVYASQARSAFYNAKAYGISAGQVEIETATLLRNVRTEVDRLNALHVELLERAGVNLVHGWGCFSGPYSISVKDRQDPDGVIIEELQGKRILIAVGSCPSRLSLAGAELAWVSDDIFQLKSFPKRIVVVGAGFIACEFAHILRGLGCDVVQLVRGHHLLRGFDRELSDVVREGTEGMGIELRFGCNLTAIEGESGAVVVRLDSGEQMEGNGVLLAVGRHPFLQNLGLEIAGVYSDGHRILVDEYQTTNISHIFAVGDVTDRCNLTPVAIDEGRAFADTIYGGSPRMVNHNLVASAVFSQPELATVGLTEEQAVEQLGPEAVTVHSTRFRSLAQALPKQGPRCLLKLVVARSDGRILGCHMVGDHAAEIIQMAAIAIGMKATKADFDCTMALHPTISEEFVTMS